jgi:hypothetical protein
MSPARRLFRSFMGARTFLSALRCVVVAFVCFGPKALGENKPTVDYAAVQQIFSKDCLDCHASQEPEAKLVLEDYPSLMKGGEHGPAILPGNSVDSLLVKMVEGRVERQGKKKIMPPGKRDKLSADEIASIKSWIDGGARAPAAGTVARTELAIPKILPTVPPRRPIHALAYSPSRKLIAVGRYGEVELVSSETRTVVRRLVQHGTVNALVFAADGEHLFAGGGDAGIAGEVQEWDVNQGRVTRSFSGHKDAIYALALSPDGKLLATGSYDQKIKLWNVASGSELRTLSGHNGAVFDISFRPDGRILASASADRTVKLWDVASGERRDTLSQAVKEVYSVVFSSDGTHLFAAGADNRIRVWQISDTAAETTNPILESRFAHDGAILKLTLSRNGQSLLSSASDGTVKLWDTATVAERLLLEPQPDWGSALTFISDDKEVVVGRLDGSLQFYDATSGKVLPPPRPELVRVEPRGLERGTTMKVKLVGSKLVHLTAIGFSDPRLKGELDLPTSDTATPDVAWVTVTAAGDLPRDAYDLWVVNAHGESGKVKLYVDNLPQVYVQHGERREAQQELPSLPVSVWATHERSGQEEQYRFWGQSGDTLVFEIAARRFGSKAEPVLTLFDSDNKVLQSTSGFEGGKDPVLAYTFTKSGEYRLSVGELVLGASVDHYYRLSVGKFPFVTGIFPLSIPKGKESEVRLIGYNLPADRMVRVAGEHLGEMPLPLDKEKYRSRQDFKLVVSDLPELTESEPNDSVAQATRITPPCAISGCIESATGGPDADCFRFDAKAGQSWIIETSAAQRGSPIDTRLEVLDAQGQPVKRLVLQAVRDSSITFRGIDSDSPDCRVVNWEEMELNQYLYLQGEVVKLFRAPQGPDSGFLFYSSHGKRRCYFDTSPAAHPVDEPCYIVEPHPPGAKLVETGLPVFPVYYDNDDDADRKLGTDSKLQFTAPADGTYFIRVTDTRGFSGPDFVYRLVVRPVEPDFRVTLRGTGLTVNAGSGQAFSVVAERLDGFEGPITVSIGPLPPGFLASTPLEIQAGHAEASGVIYASLNAGAGTAEDWAKVEVTASAVVNGHPWIKAVNNFGMVKLGTKPKLFVSLEPDPGAAAALAARGNPTGSPVSEASRAGDKIQEITIAPGQSVPAWLRVQRNGYDDLITFTVEDLPHGVIVDNIGLNGVLIPKDQNERQIFLTAAKWVPETDRLCFAVESQAGRQTSLPVLLHVRRTASVQTAAR